LGDSGVPESSSWASVTSSVDQQWSDQGTEFTFLGCGVVELICSARNTAF